MMQDYQGRDLDLEIRAVRARAATERITRRARWERVVRAARDKWRGQRVAPLDQEVVHDATCAVVRAVMEGRLLMTLAPLLVMLERMERSALIVRMLASPSGAGPERYAPRRHKEKT